MNIYVKIVVGSLLVLSTHHVMRIIFLLGFHKHLYNHTPGHCRQVQGADFGSEGIYLTPDGLAFITSGLSLQSSSSQYRQYLAAHKVKGRILLFNFTSAMESVIELDIQSTGDFSMDKFAPHGISGWIDALGDLHLFVVNHGHPYETVEKFQYLRGQRQLRHVRSYTSHLYKVLNDVVATGPDSFYFTNILTGHSMLTNSLHTFCLLPFMDLGHSSGEESSLADTGLLFPNGIDMSADGKFVYVGEWMVGNIRVYSRREDNTLTIIQVYAVDMCVDNIIVDRETGNLYVAGQPTAHEIFSHLFNPTHKSPSQVLHLKVTDGFITSAENLFVDNGTLISASSSAVVFRQKMLIGSVIDKLVYCDVASSIPRTA